jgi:cytochrome c
MRGGSPVIGFREALFRRLWSNSRSVHAHAILRMQGAAETLTTLEQLADQQRSGQITRFFAEGSSRLSVGQSAEMSVPKAGDEMKMLLQVCLMTLSIVGVAVAEELISDATATELLAQYNCQACHTMDKSSLPGPSFRDIAMRYSSDPQAVGDLQASVVNGSSGAWGDSAMPPNDVSDKDLNALIQWVLQLM